MVKSSSGLINDDFFRYEYDGNSSKDDEGVFRDGGLSYRFEEHSPEDYEDSSKDDKDFFMT